MNPKHCVNCGQRYHNWQDYTEEDGSLRCLSCDHKVWDNPLPVAVCVQPVITMDGTAGLAMAKRAIEPRLGTWNLLGGHVNNGENFEDAAVREFMEETRGVKPGTLLGITGSYQNGKGHVLVAVEFAPIRDLDWATAELCPENSEFGIWFGHTHLGFPIHGEIAARWLAASLGRLYNE